MKHSEPKLILNLLKSEAIEILNRTHNSANIEACTRRKKKYLIALSKNEYETCEVIHETDNIFTLRW